MFKNIEDKYLNNNILKMDMGTYFFAAIFLTSIKIWTKYVKKGKLH